LADELIRAKPQRTVLSFANLSRLDRMANFIGALLGRRVDCEMQRNQNREISIWVKRGISKIAV
jgi:hypothetical protein